MIRRGDIYLVDLSANLGSEQGGLRPAVVVQNDVGNQYAPTTIICPLTTQKKSLSVTHVDLSPKDCGIRQESTVLCEQVRVIDKARIKKKLGEIQNKEKINAINQKILVSFGIATGGI